MLIGFVCLVFAICGWYAIGYYQRKQVAHGNIAATKLERQVRVMLNTRVGRDEDLIAELFSNYLSSLKIRRRRLVAGGADRNAPEIAIIDRLEEQAPKWFADASGAAAMARLSQRIP